MPNYCRAAGGLLVGAGVPNEINAKIFNKIALETFFFASQHEIGEQNDLTNWANSKSGLRGMSAIRVEHLDSGSLCSSYQLPT